MKKLYLLTIFLSVFAQSQFKLIKSYGSYPLAPLRSIDGAKDMWKGKLVSTSVLMKGTNSLNKSSLAKGVYVYQIRNTIGEILSSGKIIKK